jgi:hypothetical protein
MRIAGLARRDLPSAHRAGAPAGGMLGAARTERGGGPTARAGGALRVAAALMGEGPARPRGRSQPAQSWNSSPAAKAPPSDSPM